MSDPSDFGFDLTLNITPEKFYIGAKDSLDDIISIDRLTQELRFGVYKKEIPGTANHRHIFGLLGTIKLIGGNYLVILTGRQPIGLINGQPIYQVTSTELLAYTKTQIHLNDAQIELNKSYMSMIQEVLNTPCLYFSYSYDITHTLQRLEQTSPDFLKLSLHERADPRFLWNAHLLKEFSQYKELKKYCVPLLHGFISINNCVVNGFPFLWTIVSRRSNQRVGTRFFTRGADHNGNVANFVETEQILEYGSHKCSFVQTRGSIPLLWHQLPTLKYKPRPKLIQNQNHAEAFQKHLDQQIVYYGKQVLVNLIDHRGAEYSLEQEYKKHAEQYGTSQVRYEAFDFHHECRNMQYERLTVLIDRLAYEQDQFGYFHVNTENAVLSYQSGVFRTNCIDCLDRTNVVQSLLARRNLTIMLQRLEILPNGQSVSSHPVLELLFKNVWADNADCVSVQYSGTGALKTDFTRTGKRTRLGLLRDAINSLTRYVKNNFMDGFRQDSLDLFVGNYLVKDEEGSLKPCPLKVSKGWKYYTFPIVLLVAVAMFCANVIFPTRYTTETLLYLLFWGSMVAGTVATIFNYGTEFVDFPRLSNKLKVD